MISKKCRYALRAIFELTKRVGEGPVKIAEIAKAQAIPQRFLEAILLQLKQSGFIESRRGSDGGYLLRVDPATLTVGNIVRAVQGYPEPIDCLGDNPSEECPLRTNCAFLPMWSEMKMAINNIYDSTTFKSLVEKQYACGEKEINPSI